MMFLVGGAVATGLLSTEDLKDSASLGSMAIAIFQYSFYGFIYVIYQVRSSQYYMHHLTAAEGEVQFECRLTLGETLMMYAEQALLMIVTLGLAWPWVQVAITKYKAEHTVLKSKPGFYGELEQGAVDVNVGSVGEELASFWDFDIGF